MARPLRIAFEGAFYHVTARGNEWRKIFLSHWDYEKFLSYLTEAVQKGGVLLHAFVPVPCQRLTPFSSFILEGEVKER